MFEANGDGRGDHQRGVPKAGVSTPVFARFSTVLGSRGSPDTVRDVRGFATKFYTAEGNFDLVGNNIPVFFIRDGIKFPDLIHAAKPEPDVEIPQAQTAHTTFWDFVSLIPESPHMLMWAMSDRAIPRSYRMMEGFGVHTFRLVNDAGETSLVKFHWKPLLGVHGLVWEEALTLNGVDPDFHRRDLYNAIAAGAFPQWELGVQVMPDTDDQYFEGIDLLDSTKLVPEELAPVQTIGTLTLNRRPTQLLRRGGAGGVPRRPPRARHRGGRRPADARPPVQLPRHAARRGWAVPNFDQIPINRPHAPVDDLRRDGFSQQAVHAGRTPYLPNGVGGGCPFLATAEEGGYEHVPRQVMGPKVRERGPDDPYAQATLFWNSMTPVEQDHIVDAYTFELSKVEVLGVVKRMVRRLVHVHPDLATRVAYGLGLDVADLPPTAEPDEVRHPDAPDASRRRGRVAGAGHGHRGRVAARRPGRADPRRRRRRPHGAHGAARRHRGGRRGGPRRGHPQGPHRRASARPTRCWSTAPSTPPARPKRTPSWWPPAPGSPTSPGRSPTCKRPSATTSPSRRGATAPSCSTPPASTPTSPGS